jgi:hypothetical protein
VAPFQYLRIESFYSAFGKKNRAAPFFVWLKSRIERSHSIICLVREPCECRGEKRRVSAHVRESARIRSFLWSESIPTTYSKFLYGDLGVTLLLFCWKPNVQKIEIEPLYSPLLLNQTHPKSYIISSIPEQARMGSGHGVWHHGQRHRTTQAFHFFRQHQKKYNTCFHFFFMHPLHCCFHSASVRQHTPAVPCGIDR